MTIRLLTAAMVALTAAMPLAAADQTAQTAVSAPVDPDARMKCRRVQVTGSLVKAEKVCKTVGEWRRLSDRGNDAVRDIYETGRVCAGGACGNGG